MRSFFNEDISKAGAKSLRLQKSFKSEIQYVRPPKLADSKALVFVSNEEMFRLAQDRGCSHFIMLEKLYPNLQAELKTNSSVWVTQSIQASMAEVLPLFDIVSQWHKQGVHPKAEIHPTAEVSADVHIGAGAVVGAHAKIGSGTVLFPNCFIGPYCEIGNNCQIGPGTSIGYDGFGFVTDKDFHHSKIPQIGKVVIEDNCELGASCAVDRGTLHETRIKKGSKLDNFCHIAHNVEVGENAMITAGFIVAGSTVIGKNLMTSGAVHMLGHLNVSDNVVLSARAGVLQDIEKPGMYGGYPLESHKESIKTLVSIPQIKVLRRQVQKILNHLNLKWDE